MALTLLDLRTLFRSYIDDPNAERFTNAEANRFINLGQKYVQDLIVDSDEWYFASCQTYSVLSTSDSYEFDLPSDLMQVIQCERDRPGERPIMTEFVDFRNRHTQPAENTLFEVNDNQSSSPLVYLRGSKLGVVAPASSYTLRLWYVPRLTDLSADLDTSLIPEEHQNLVALHAAKLSKGENTPWPEPLQQIYRDDVERLRSFTEQRQRQQSRAVNYVVDY
jgi:hypothetical protein